MDHDSGKRESSNAAQTASLGNQEMLTYMKIPNPTSVEAGITPSTEEQEDDLRFSSDINSLFNSGGSNDGSERDFQTSCFETTCSVGGTSAEGMMDDFRMIFPFNSARANERAEKIPQIKLKQDLNQHHLQTLRTESSSISSRINVSNPANILSSLPSGSHRSTIQSVAQHPQHALFSIHNTQVLPQNSVHQEQSTVPVSGTARIQPWTVMSAPQQVPSLMISPYPSEPQNQSNVLNNNSFLNNNFAHNVDLQTVRQDTRIEEQSSSTHTRKATPVSLMPLQYSTKKRPRASSTGSSSKDEGFPTTSLKQLDTLSVSEDESDKMKRRRDRNLREQERSQRIANQITQLKDILALSNVQFKPDKYSTLVTAAEYIKSLQQRSIVLDAEHRKLVDTIARTNEVVNSSQLGTQSYITTPSNGSSNKNSDQEVSNTLHNKSRAQHDSGRNDKSDQDLSVFVQGLDYKRVFSKSVVALAVTTIDGRLLDCNDEFIHVCGINDEQLLSSGLNLTNKKCSKSDEIDMKSDQGTRPLSLFNVLRKEDMQLIFSAMSEMLKSTEGVLNKLSSKSKENETVDTTNKMRTEKNLGSLYESDHWSGFITHSKNTNTKLQLSINLVRTREGIPKYFNCSITPYPK
mmetsp:Transcript_6699/g.9659  ORF Transcript_6699/g.9659 Transcript_6699/m.9659 type:complete len:632 (-) Transcript_6699:545-2440(-)|eukprot:CAMPEP_0184865766 /NCGR_PEP_ID=MMETSP0580-20130426/18982_1 /TAXON_ID=1118495 /ORGANISM="Dactyliosolen fragilissimus" /LENGTH=631 /DNA_ID=CAMNT_0027365077 /DNA_START=80 /DNA_END=1975 /DNA_ORIENTATION=+